MNSDERLKFEETIAKQAFGPQGTVQQLQAFIAALPAVDWTFPYLAQWQPIKAPISWWQRLYTFIKNYGFV